MRQIYRRLGALLNVETGLSYRGVFFTKCYLNMILLIKATNDQRKDESNLLNYDYFRDCEATRLNAHSLET